MTAPHLFAPALDGDTVTIEGPDAHHAVRVLRLRMSERVTVSDGAGNVADGVVTSVSDALELKISDIRFIPRPLPSITVVQGIPKGDKLDTIVQKLTEIGVDEIIPLKAQRSIAKWDGAKKLVRARAIAREAAKQSHRAWLPKVAEPCALDAIHGGQSTFVLHEEAKQGLLASLPFEQPEHVTLLIGPEGGFDPSEIEALDGRATPVTLGASILRTETAALVAASLIMGHYGRIG